MSEISIGGHNFRVIYSDGVPDNHILVLPSARGRVQDHHPDGTPYVRDETLDEFARRCWLIKGDPS